MLIVDFPWLPGSQRTVLAVTLLFNKPYLPYILPCVWKFFSNPRLDHDKIICEHPRELANGTHLPTKYQFCCTLIFRDIKIPSGSQELKEQCCGSNN